MNSQLKQKHFINYFLIPALLLIIGSCQRLEVTRQILVTTDTVSQVTVTSAVLSGNIKDMGDGVVQYGHCWSTKPNPNIDSANTQLGKATKTGEYTSPLSGLLPGTTYYFRAYATDGKKIVYGNEHNFTTLPPKVPVVSTGIVRDITKTSAVVISTLTSLGEGCDTVFQYGHCWQTTKGPTILDSITNLGKLTDTATFSSSLKNLQIGTTYYVRAYAINKAGVAYGEEESFTTVNPTLATVITGVTNNLTTLSVTVTGELKALGIGIDTVLQYGHCWSLTQDPNIYDSVTKFGIKTKTGSFTSHLTKLQPGKTYYIKAYATNSAGTAYGEQISITAIALTLPTISTGTPHNLTSLSADVTGSITALGTGSDSITQYGHCWSLNAQPTIYDSVSEFGIKTATGNFTTHIKYLSPGKTYYVRAYAASKVGIAYGEQQNFKTPAELPVLSTYGATSISYNTVVTGGQITYDGGASISERGVCWDTLPDPNISDDKLLNGSGFGNFQSNLSGLLAGKTYYLRAYATNEAGTSYGNAITFTTKPYKIPKLTTISVSGTIYNEASSGGNITDDGGQSILAAGICWSTRPGPTLADSFTISTVNSGYFTSNATWLKCDSTYYLRAYATNAQGTAYGNEVSFTTSRLFDYDGNSYKWVQIGNQVWMAENLRTTHYADGLAIPNGTGVTDTFQIGDRYWFLPYDDSTYKETYGLYYTWYAAVRGINGSNSIPSGIQGACPIGWHIPSRDEFDMMISNVGGNSVAGGRLKEVGTVHWQTPNTGANNQSGFTAIGSGLRRQPNYTLLSFEFNSLSSSLWIDSNFNNYYILDILYNSESGYSYYGAELYTKSSTIRCLKD